MQTLIKFCSTGLLLALSTSILAAERIPASKFDINNLQVGPAARSASSFNTKSMTQAFGVSANNQFSKVKEAIDKSGNSHSRYRQTYMGIPIWGEAVIIHKKSKGKSFATGYVIQGLESSDIQDVINSNALISKSEALSIVQKKKKHDPQTWNINNVNTELTIFLAGSSPRVAYQVNYMAYPKQHKQKPTRPHVILDAISGKILKEWDGLAHAEIGTGPGGNTKTGRYDYGTDHSHLDVTQENENCTLENTNVKTINLNHSTNENATNEAHSFVCPENTVKSINGAYSPLNDAHFFGNLVYKMFQEWLEVPPLNFQLKMKVHFDSNFENAFWDGSSMTFGDGGDNLYPLVDVNVSAHEVSHGFTEQNSNLIYSGQSGGINEAFSDIAGEAAEFYFKGSVDWLVGADITKNVTAMRYFEDPTQDGVSIGHASDFEDNMDVHFSSGVFNRAFYLIANTDDWDIPSAFKIFAFANMNYWTPSTNFIDGACGVMHAANDLNLNYMEVDKAFQTVGVQCQNTPFTDTDEDQMDDYWEALYGLNPNDPADAQLDLDEDGLLNLEEFPAGSSPLLLDTDEDGLSDFSEVRQHITDPANADSDGDSMPDGFELENNFNPLIAADGNLDSDGDGYTNTIEFDYETDLFDRASYPTFTEISFEDGTIPTNWDGLVVGDNEWYLVTSSSSHGSYSLRSGRITNNEIAAISFTDEFDGGTFSFSAKVSSEEFYDGFLVGLNGEIVFSLTGEIDWKEYSFNVPKGTNTIDFLYVKDESDFAGQDRAWIDNIYYAPLDSDEDGLPDYWEEENGLDSNNAGDASADTDSDGLSNYQEFKLKTNINSSDSDNDNMPDLWEYQNELNPAVDDGDLDFDSDGLSNEEEYGAGTDPFNADSDSDGLNDEFEITSRGTSPTNRDSDNDGVNDQDDFYPNDPSRHQKEASGSGSAHYLFLLVLLSGLIRLRHTR